MKKFVVTWTFMRHIHRQREYKLLTKIIDAKNEYFADFEMITDSDVQALFKKGFNYKMKSYTCISDIMGIVVEQVVKPPLVVMPNKI